MIVSQNVFTSMDYWEERANKVLSHFNHKFPDEIDIYEIINRYGIIIKPLDQNYCDFDIGDMKAFSVPKKKGRRGIVYIKPELDSIEKKLLLAEEFCHLYAHHTNQISASSLCIDKMEAQAKRMSAYLLMPWLFFKRVLDISMDQTILVSDIADYFVVTEEFAHFRLELTYRNKIDAISNVKGKIMALEVLS